MISFLIPTRGRPDRFNRLMATIEATTVGECEALVKLDDDDKRLSEYKLDYKNMSHWVGPRMCSPAGINFLAPFAKGQHFSLPCDDQTSHTMGWDKLLEDKVPADNIYIASPSFGGGEMHTVGRTWYDILGFISPKEFDHYFASTWMLKFAAVLGRHVTIPMEWREERNIDDETSSHHIRDGYLHINNDNGTLQEKGPGWILKYAPMFRAKMKG
jgi:hypothetical protein